MMHNLKKRLYFFVAGYFRFFARIVLERWQPYIVVVTGSNGKTTLLNLIEAQLGNEAVYSHKANSSFGIPFHILGLKRETLAKSEWLKLFILTPVRAFRKVPSQKYYIVEADVDRVGEGRFLARFLRPEVSLWVSSDKTHSMGFDAAVASGRFKTVEEAIAYEYGWFVQETRDLVILKDQQSMIAQLDRSKTKLDLRRNPRPPESLEEHKASVSSLTEPPSSLRSEDKHSTSFLEDSGHPRLPRKLSQHKTISMSQLAEYKLSRHKTMFKTKKGSEYDIAQIMPKEAFIQVGMTHMLVKYLKLDFDPHFASYRQPPGRSSIFDGIKHTTIFDSSYNANLASDKVALETFSSYPGTVKWVILGDMLEQGRSAEEEHRKLAHVVAGFDFDKVILMGSLVKKYTKPELLKDSRYDNVVAFEEPAKLLAYLEAEIKGDEVLFFKGARWMEGVIKHLLKDPGDEKYLCRREEHYQKIRQKWGVG